MAGSGEGRPDPNTRRCADCGHVWFAGERRHAYVDDGDAVVCVLCLQVRRRGEPPSEHPWQDSNLQPGG